MRIGITALPIFKERSINYWVSEKRHITQSSNFKKQLGTHHLNLTHVLQPTRPSEAGRLSIPHTTWRSRPQH